MAAGSGGLTARQTKDFSYLTLAVFAGLGVFCFVIVAYDSRRPTPEPRDIALADWIASNITEYVIMFLFAVIFDPAAMLLLQSGLFNAPAFTAPLTENMCFSIRIKSYISKNMAEAAPQLMLQVAAIAANVVTTNDNPVVILSLLSSALSCIFGLLSAFVFRIVKKLRKSERHISRVEMGEVPERADTFRRRFMNRGMPLFGLVFGLFDMTTDITFIVDLARQRRQQIASGAQEVDSIGWLVGSCILVVMPMILNIAFVCQISNKVFNAKNDEVFELRSERSASKSNLQLAENIVNPAKKNRLDLGSNSRPMKDLSLKQRGSTASLSGVSLNPESGSPGSPKDSAAASSPKDEPTDSSFSGVGDSEEPADFEMKKSVAGSPH